MNGANIIKGAIYATHGAFAVPLKFYEKAFSEGEITCNSIDQVCNKISQTRRTLMEKAYSKSFIDQSAAASILIARDLEAVEKTTRMYIKDEDLREDYLHVNFEKLKKLFEEHGIDIGDINFSVVDKFPEPYHEMNFWAMNYDTDDEQTLGIPRGVCLKREYLMPMYSVVLMAHELIHVAIGKVNENLLARGFEEGLCDLFGSLYLCSQLIPQEICENMLKNSRLSYPREQIRQVYTDALRQVLLLHENIGVNGLTEIIRKGNAEGRGIIKKIEALCIEDKYQLIPINNKGIKDEGISKFARFYISFPTSLVVSPLAYLLSEKLSPSMKIESLLNENKIDLEEGKKAIRELQERVFLVVADNERIIYDDTKAVLKNKMLRYELAFEGK